MWRSLTAIAALSFACALPAGAHAEQNCYAPTWQRVSKPMMGLEMEVTTDTYESFFVSEGFPAVDIGERMRGGDEVDGRCSSFSVSMTDFGEQEIADTRGFFDHMEKEALTGLNNGKKLSSRSLTFQGYPAREYSYSFTTDVFHDPAANRVLLVVRGNKLYSFFWSWGDAAAAPADSNRIFNSIRFMTVVPNPHMLSTAMLEKTIKDYWLYRASNVSKPGYFNDYVRGIADSKLAQETAIVKGYGYFESPQYLRTENGFKVFRIKHENATVDWYVQDNGKEITALTWRKR